MTSLHPMTRRVFLADLGRGAAAIAVVGVAACMPSSGASPSGARASGAGTSGSPAREPTSTPATPGSASPAPGGSGSDPTSPPGGADGVAWHRVNLGFVSAYVLVRGGEAAVVDTGVAGSEGAIEQALTAAGLAWDAVGHVIVTHKHGDHAGSVEAVLGRAASAQGYAGSPDIPAIRSPRPLTAVVDNNTVMGLRIVATPGHTPGHIAVFDPAGGIFVAGDALGTQGGRPTPPGAQFTEDMTVAMASIATIGELPFETLLVGHGDPIESGAAALVRELAARG